jgi:hypothetical protein
MLLADDRWRQNSGCHHQNIIKSDFGTWSSKPDFKVIEQITVDANLLLPELQSLAEKQTQFLRLKF